jgi:hypothetical protein
MWESTATAVETHEPSLWDDFAYDIRNWNACGEDMQPSASEGKNHSKLDWVMQKSSSKGGSMHDNGGGGID